MRDSTRDIFGDTDEVQPATPGSYGQAPAGYRLPEGTRLGPVRLQVADLERSLAFYRGTLGLRLHARESSSALLGSQDDTSTLVELNERRGVRPAPRRGRIGLFHFAILLPDRASLGRFAKHLGEIGTPAGAADHLVSEAFYLQDPDNLGIEVYADRPRSTWRRIGRELMMATDPIDLAGVLEAAGGERWSGMPPGTVLGHVHLHVGDLAAAAAFYSEALGFDRTVWDYPGALFMGAGGYHHHLGTNTWAGPGARPPADADAQLLEWTIDLPDLASLWGASASLERAGHSARTERDAEDPTIVTSDPWGTRARLRLARTASAG